MIFIPIGLKGCDISEKRKMEALFLFKISMAFDEENNCLYRSLNIVRVIKARRLRWAGHVARMEEGRSAFKMLTGTPARKRSLGRSRRRWEDNIRMDLEETGINTGNWVDSAQCPCECGIEPPGSISHGVS